MLWVVFSLFIIIIIIIIIILVIIVIIVIVIITIIIVIITIIIINIIIIIVIIVIIIINLRRICYKFQAVVTASSTSSGAAVTAGQVARKSSRPKSCRPEPESCCPKFAVMSPEILSHVARNPKTFRPKFYLVSNLEKK